MKQPRTSDLPIDPLFLNRWSPRAYDASPMPKRDLDTILEAARWAPSAFNVQPWRFLFSLQGDQHWNTYISLLDPFNAAWAQHASALVFIVSDTLMPSHEDRPQRQSRYNSFDAGAAWAQLALQASSLGYHAHAMAGIHFDQVKTELSIPETFRIEVAVALGVKADPTALPEDLQEREQPSPRRAIEETAFSGVFRHD